MAGGARGAQHFAPLMLWLLVTLWVCNVGDLLLTRAALASGRATESNAAMALLFRQGTWAAGAAKMAVVSLGVILLWRLRRHRVAFVAAVTLAIVFVALVTYEMLWVWGPGASAFG